MMGGTHAVPNTGAVAEPVAPVEPLKPVSTVSKRRFAIVAPIVGVALLCAACAGGPSPGGSKLRADISVVIQDPQGSPVSYVIRCDAGEASVRGGAPIDAKDACRALARPAVQNRLVRGPSPEQVCTQVYGGPQTAMLSGTLDRRSVSTVVTRDDGCGIGDWDNLLKDILLPVSRGPR